MRISSNFRKTQKIFFSLGVTVIALFIGIISAIIIIGDSGKTYLQTDAVINEITEDDSDPENIQYSVFVDYTVNGKQYSHINLGSYSSFMKEGDTVSVLYLEDSPETIKQKGWDIFFCVVAVVCFGAAALGIFFFVKAVKSTPADEFHRTDDFTDEEIDRVRLDDEPSYEYFFHYDKGGIKAGHILETADGVSVYEAKMEKLTLFKPYIFTFSNRKTLHSRTVSVGHTVTTSVGSVFPNMSSSFKFDGTDVWDYIGKKGYSIDFELKGLTPVYCVSHCGVSVAEIKTTGTNQTKQSKNPLAKIPANGYYKVTSKDSDLDIIFLICFALARTESITANH